jgi:CHASE3 domain sensor protein
MRSDTNDRLDALKAAQLQALQELSKMGSQALVEALRDVIKDFNAKITEQFGDNFKELNAAVVTTGLWVAATGIVALSLESFGAALVLFSIAGWLLA